MQNRLKKASTHFDKLITCRLTVASNDNQMKKTVLKD